MAAVAAAVTLPILLTRGGPPGLGGVEPNAVGEIEPVSGTIVRQIAVGRGPASLAAGAGGLWAANVADRTVMRVDLDRRAVVATVRCEASPTSLAAGLDLLWAANCTPGAVARIDPQFNAIRNAIPLGRAGAVPPQVALGTGVVWATSGGTRLIRIDHDTGRVDARIVPPVGAGPLAVGGDSVWTGRGNAVAAIDRRSNLRVGTVRLPGSLAAVAAGEGAVWAATDRPALVKIDPDTLAIAATLPLPGKASALAAGEGGVWVALPSEGAVLQIAPESPRIVRTIHTGNAPAGLAVGYGSIWVSVG